MDLFRIQLYYADFVFTWSCTNPTHPQYTACPILSYSGCYAMHAFGPWIGSGGNLISATGNFAVLMKLATAHAKIVGRASKSGQSNDVMTMDLVLCSSRLRQESLFLYSNYKTVVVRRVDGS